MSSAPHCQTPIREGIFETCSGLADGVPDSAVVDRCWRATVATRSVCSSCEPSVSTSFGQAEQERLAREARRSEAQLATQPPPLEPSQEDMQVQMMSALLESEPFHLAQLCKNAGEFNAMFRNLLHHQACSTAHANRPGFYAQHNIMQVVCSEMPPRSEIAESLQCRSRHRSFTGGCGRRRRMQAS